MARATDDRPNGATQGNRADSGQRHGNLLPSMPSAPATNLLASMRRASRPAAPISKPVKPPLASNAFWTTAGATISYRPDSLAGYNGFWPGIDLPSAAPVAPVRPQAPAVSLSPSAPSGDRVVTGSIVRMSGAVSQPPPIPLPLPPRLWPGHKDAAPDTSVGIEPASSAAESVPSAAPAQGPTAASAPPDRPFATSSATARIVKPPDFYHADTNFDAKIEFDEAKKIWPQLTRRYFETFDLEGTGFLNADEYYRLVKHPPT